MINNLNRLEVDWNLGINVTIVGIAIVFSMLVLLVFVLTLFGAFSKTGNKDKKDEKVKEQPVEAVKATPTVSKTTNNSNDDIIPVIAAAVAYMYEGSSVKPVIRAVKKSGHNARPAWTSAGIYENTRAF